VGLLAFAVGLGVMAALALSAVVWFVFHAIVWLVLLPFRLLGAILTLPFLLLKVLLAIVVGVVAFGLALGGIVLVAALTTALVAPILPLLLVVGLTWAVVRLMRRPAAA
jgi:hypothetical protein